MHMDVEIATEALRAGASGYVLKHSATDALNHAIWEVLEGQTFVSPRNRQGRDGGILWSIQTGQAPSQSS
jgi:DNA-binding NarL/FixJ family response regulator